MWTILCMYVHVSGCMRWFYEDYLELAPSALLNTFDWILKCRRCPPSLNQPLSSFPLFSKLHRPYVMLCKWSLYEWYGIFNCTFSFYYAEKYSTSFFFCSNPETVDFVHHISVELNGLNLVHGQCNVCKIIKCRSVKWT